MAKIDAASELAKRHATYNKGQGDTDKRFNAATMEFLEKSGMMWEQETKLFEGASHRMLLRMNSEPFLSIELLKMSG